MTEVMKENSRLRDKMKEMEDTPVSMPFPECKEYDHFLEKCVYLEGQLFQKLVVIDNFARGRDREKTKKLFKETKEWSEGYFRKGGPLYYIVIRDPPY